MRLIGSLPDKKSAALFSDYLFVRGIKNQYEPAADAAWELWVLEDDLVPAATGELERFRANPADPIFSATALEADAKAREEEKRGAGGKVVDVRTQWSRPGQMQLGFVTIGLMIFSVGVFLADITNPGQLNHLLYITEINKTGDGMMSYMRGLPEVMHGQVWRLLTPIFLHFGFIHILFNMLMLKDLGNAVEKIGGSIRVAAMAVLFGVSGNLLQYALHGPAFGGMSGVVYGLFGYVWIFTVNRPDSNYYMHKQTVITLLLWFVLCAVGIIPGVANAAHAAGLGLGVLWAAVETRRLPFTGIRF
ncbi:hypothetical protein BH09SUM1_BH09SUM1_25490 [soil metagenome]